MKRRNFLKGIIAAPIAAVIPAVAKRYDPITNPPDIEGLPPTPALNPHKTVRFRSKDRYSFGWTDPRKKFDIPDVPDIELPHCPKYN